MNPDDLVTRLDALSNTLDELAFGQDNYDAFIEHCWDERLEITLRCREYPALRDRLRAAESQYAGPMTFGTVTTLADERVADLEARLRTAEAERDEAVELLRQVSGTNRDDVLDAIRAFLEVTG